uniref:MutS_I domain-containing protein n=1 Tax=Strongyloides papillosus TaxID=174720 RepID=A0A0N5BPB3_STREA
MKGHNFAYTSIFSKSYEFYAHQLVSLGFKVGRVERTNISNMKLEFFKGIEIEDGKVAKELCQIESVATRFYTPVNGFKGKRNHEESDSDIYLMLYIVKKKKDVCLILG